MTGGTKSEKAAFGNEVDFFGDPVTGLQEVGFRVFTTGENCGNSGGVCSRPGNLPNITFEIDPDVDSGGNPVNYTSLVFLPDGIPFADVNKWSGYIDATATGQWFMTGTAGTVTGCGQSSTCEFDEAMDALAGATIYTAQVAKGRDHAWVGAVDGLRINDTVYDFEPSGVEEEAAS
jgi:hypothetical protein